MGEHGEFDLGSFGKDGQPGGSGEYAGVASWQQRGRVRFAVLTAALLALALASLVRGQSSAEFDAEARRIGAAGLERAAAPARGAREPDQGPDRGARPALRAVWELKAEKRPLLERLGELVRPR